MLINRIKEFRIKGHLSGIRLACMCDLGSSQIYEFENMKREPWPRARRALCKALNVTESELFPGGVK